jgi:GNAT superfamily N-acetyltransferase
MATLNSGQLQIRCAQPHDTATILRFICALADYEKLRDSVVATEDKIAATLFGPRPSAEVLIAERVAIDGSAQAIGFALFFHSYSTFLAQPGLYLEDLFVDPSARGFGVGLALMAALARIAVDRDCGRFEWSVLDWNTPSIEFYRALGSKPQSEWTVERLTGNALHALANKSPTIVGL